MEYSDLPTVIWKNDGFVIGLTGAIGSGKSETARYFQEEGARVINADLIARDELHSAKNRTEILSLFGEGILDASGDISRNKLGGIVFENPEKRTALNRIIHPAVRKRFLLEKKSLRDGMILVYDIPLLFETGDTESYDLTVVVSAPLEVRIARAIKRDGWTREHFLDRENSQMPLSEKEHLADYVIRNEGTLVELSLQVKELLNHIRKSRVQREV